MNNHCNYCENILSLPINDQREPWDKILYETSNFIVAPTLGALIEGWILIISKRHVPSMGALTEEELSELDELTIRVRSLVEQEYGSTIMFEHGPACEGTAFGCGIDHAHLHVVPLNIPITSLVEKELKVHLTWEKIADFSELSRKYLTGIPYLYVVENNTEKGMLICPQYLPSQFMRRVIANFLGIPQLYNYHDYNFRENVSATSKSLSAAFDKDKCLV
jgi:ATP adenylyltransferase